MKKSMFSAPTDFSISPLLSLLPERGNIGKLSILTHSLFARYEKVSGLRKDLGDDSSTNIRKLAAEETMLKQVLEFLSVNL